MSRRRWVVALSCVLAGVLAITIGVAGYLRPVHGGRAVVAVPSIDVGTLPAPDPTHPDTGRASRKAPPHPVPAGTRLHIGRVGVDAPVTHVGLDGRVMQVPRDPHLLGWWTGGAAPGDARGSVVVVGHVNYAGTQGPFAKLPRLRPGDAVTLTEPGADHRYRVDAVRTYPKTKGLPSDAFDRSSSPRLVLITCGGSFDSATGNYVDNIVVYASPA